MTAPPLLLIDPDEARRGGLSQGMTAAGYEVIPAADAEEGLRFARSFQEAVVVASAELPEILDGSFLNASGNGRTVVLLGAPQGRSAFSEDVSFIPTGAALVLEDLCRKLHLVLVGRELGIDADSRCEALVGDLSLTPLPELLGGLGEARFSGRVELERGALHLDLGEVVAARSEPVRGVKAFCRLSRLGSGAFRVVPGSFGVEREIEEDLSTLTVAAIEDSMGEFPDLQTTVRIEIGPEFFARELSAEQQRIVQAAQRGTDLRTLLDASPEPDGAVMDELLQLVELGIAILEKPNPAVFVMTDSTADLPLHVARESGVHIVPLRIRFGEQVFRDGVDLETRKFYELLESNAAHPSTEPPTEDDFAEVYRKPLTESDVVSIHISGKLSETIKSAKSAAERELAATERQPAHLEVIDSGAVSVGLGYPALFAARMAGRGLAADAIRRHLDAITPRIHMLFLVDTLDYLVRGGRIGKARGLLGKILGIRPILGMERGEVVAVERVRGGRAAYDRLIEILGERLDPGAPTVMAVVHAKAPARADRMRRLIEKRFQVTELLVAEMGPVVGTHVGPGMVGALGFQPTAEEAALIAPPPSGAL